MRDDSRKARTAARRKAEIAVLPFPDFGLPLVEPEVKPVTYRRRVQHHRQRALAGGGGDISVVHGDREHFASLAYLTGYDSRLESAKVITDRETNRSRGF